MQELTQEYLKSVLDYDYETGIFTWKVIPSNSVLLGSIAGHLNKNDGYVEISIKNKSYRAHRLAWFYKEGEWPEEVDHKDTIRHHNWIDNLRPSTRAQNTQNIRNAHRDNIHGLLGVCIDKSSNRFYSSIMKKGVRYHLGRFDTAVEAHEAYIAAKRKHHEFNTL